MNDEKNVRFFMGDSDGKDAKNFVYRPEARNATVGVKFSQGIRILDPWYLIGGTRWTRTLFRLKHPIVYGKRGICNLYRSIKRFFFGDPPRRPLRLSEAEKFNIKIK
jgi:hypothetical protein